MKLPQIDLKIFYRGGIVLFLIIAVANTFTLFNNWDILLLPQRISSTSSIIFNLLLVGLFSYFYNTIPKPVNLGDSKTEKEIEDFVSSLKD